MGHRLRLTLQPWLGVSQLFQEHAEGSCVGSWVTLSLSAPGVLE